MRKGYLRLAVRSLRANKARSLLTLLGIIIGVVAVICVICIGQGVKKQVAHQVGQYGDDTLIVEPKSLAQGSSFGGGLPTGASGLLSAKDASTVADTRAVIHSAPLAVIAGSASGDHAVSDPLVIATGTDFAGIIHQQFSYGSFLSAGDQVPSVVLGSSIARQLFDDEAPIGQTVRFRDQNYIVSGIFKPFAVTPLSPNANFNDALFVSYTNAAALNGGPLGIYQILAQTASAQDAPAVAIQVRKGLETNHGGAHDVSVQPATTAATGGSDATVQLLTGLVSGAAAIALLVGGIGIMNIMLVSVTERMHEIGLRKAIGATNRQILSQFVAEAFVLSLAGAVIGIIVSLAVIGELHFYSSLKPVLVWQAFVLAPLFSILIGVLFGTIPAVKAARKDPIEALRHE